MPSINDKNQKRLSGQSGHPSGQINGCSSLPEEKSDCFGDLLIFCLILKLGKHRQEHNKIFGHEAQRMIIFHLAE